MEDGSRKVSVNVGPTVSNLWKKADSSFGSIGVGPATCSGDACCDDEDDVDVAAAGSIISDADVDADAEVDDDDDDDVAVAAAAAAETNGSL
jgi:hypothetical protein